MRVFCSSVESQNNWEVRKLSRAAQKGFNKVVIQRLRKAKTFSLVRSLFLFRVKCVLITSHCSFSFIACILFFSEGYFYLRSVQWILFYSVALKAVASAQLERCHIWGWEWKWSRERDLKKSCKSASVLDWYNIETKI